MKKKTPLSIISGIGPGSSGTGAVMVGLIQEASGCKDIAFTFKRASSRNPIRLLSYLVNRISYPWAVRRAAARSENVLLMHPQTIGLPLLRSVVESREHTWMYVLDHSTFCLRSYNCLGAESAPCLRCLGNAGEPARMHGCVNWFRSGPFQEYLPGWVKSGKLRLIAQCRTHHDLLRRHFGPEATIVTIPLSVPDITPPTEQASRAPRARRLAVFHGACNHAKGIAHVLALAVQMPDWDFVVPSSQAEFEKDFGKPDSVPGNVEFRKASWAGGLKELVVSADLVLCPSSWSAPVEGAVLKSLAHNGLVGLYLHETSFASEVPADARIDINPSDMAGTAQRIRGIVDDAEASASIRRAARRFIADYSEKSQFMLERLRQTCVSPR